jgi:polyphosphate kinase
LEKITLEEFAARLGKTVEESKSTNDVVDIVMSKGTSSNSNNNISDSFSAIAERAFRRERQISHTPFSISKKDLQEKVLNNNDSKSKTANKSSESMKEIIKKATSSTKDRSEECLLDVVHEITSQNEINIVLKKSLTDREQLVFEYFLNNIGKTVYAKDLAELLELPRDYVYKYIKNLRAKIEGDKLKNVPSGGFILTE